MDVDGPHSEYPFILMLYHRDACIGHAMLGPLIGNRHQGRLVPNEAYADARPAIQQMTLGVMALVNEGVEMRDALLRAVDVLKAEGLCLREGNGREVATRIIMVADYYPAENDASDLFPFLPLTMMVELDP